MLFPTDMLFNLVFHKRDISTGSFLKFPLNTIFFFVPAFQTSPPFGETTLIVGVVVAALVMAATLSSPTLNQFQKLALALSADKTTATNIETTSPTKIIFLFFIFDDLMI